MPDHRMSVAVECALYAGVSRNDLLCPQQVLFPLSHIASEDLVTFHTLIQGFLANILFCRGCKRNNQHRLGTFLMNIIHDQKLQIDLIHLVEGQKRQICSLKCRIEHDSLPYAADWHYRLMHYGIACEPNCDLPSKR